ncbi:Z1 domain protein [Streptococcus sanguinis]|nr:Z1 domain protein [Streptococcus sanguinis]
MYKLEDYKEVQSFIETYISSGLAKEMILKLDANNYRRLLVMYKLEDYKEVQSFIETYISSGLAKEMILKLDANFITPILKRGENYQDVWNSLVEEYFALHATIDIIKLGRNRSEINIPTNRGSSWKNYERKLEKQGWNQISIETLKKSTVEILSYLSNSRESNGISKGLVLGNVQSGKTANMSGVISMAADLGYNFFIVLSGTIENLRNQTANRLYNDVRETSNLTWRLVDRPSLRSNLPDQKISKFLLNENDKDRYLTVCLKNKSRLENLIRWLYSDENKTRQLKVLVIDDEADQASVNTNKIEEQDPTTINKLIKELVNKGNVKAMNYIAYTATPYANILNETANDSLYPKDFIVVLPKSTDYIGPEEMFGTSEPEQVQKVDIVREISDYDVQVIRGLGKGEAIQIPKSLEEAIDWFIISTGAMRHLGYRKPISMLIHTSFKVNDHESIAKIVTSYVKKIRNNPSEFFSKLEILYMNEKIDFSRQRFLDNMENYSSPDAVPAYPNWVDIREQIERIFRLDDNEYLSHVQLTDNGEPKYHEGFHIAIDNSKMTSADEMIRLVYPSSVNATKLAPAFIVIGGNTLSRGLTIEGLVSTFF